jgi:hypothetical protein
MDPPLLTLGVQTLIGDRGARWVRGAVGSNTQYYFRASISDTLTYATEILFYARNGTGPYFKLGDYALFQSTFFVGISPNMLVSTGWTDFAIIPLNLRNTGRLITVSQVSF